ncbi:MAG: hypothetical protein IT519_08125 [Burkholderiales bacterium]|jgi:outer membrane lipoprotein SlyB|nr:hypothetical protein [Burkholderiales bacterium]
MKPQAIRWALAGAALAAVAAPAFAQSSVSYGRVTAVRSVTVDSSNAQVGGALVGGTVGLVSGSNRSSSNQALRGVGGAAAGRRIGGAMGSSQAWEYTVLLGGGSTTTMVSDQAGKRVGDCVAIERGSFNNIRLVDDSRCAPPARAAAAPAPAPAASPAAIRQSDACIQAKEQLLKAETDDAFDRAERRVRLLCGE